MIESVNIDFKEFKNCIDCSFILSELDIFKLDYAIFKDSPEFLEELKDEYCACYIKINNDKIELLKNYGASSKYLNKTINFLENDICLKYLNNEINEKQFKNKMSDFYFNEVLELMIEIKKYLLENGFLKTYEEYTDLSLFLTNDSFFNMLNKIQLDISNNVNDSNIIIYDQQSETIINKMNLDRVLLIDFKDLIDSGYRFLSHRNVINFTNCQKYEQLDYQVNNKRLEKFNIIKKKIFNEIEYYLDLLNNMEDRYFSDKSEQILTCFFDFILYGLYFKLFNKEEIYFLEKNKILFFLSKKRCSEDEFKLLLNKNNFDLTYAIDIEIDKKFGIYYPKKLLILNDKTSTITRNWHYDKLAKFLLKYFQYLIEYNKVVFNNDNTDDEYLFTEDVILYFKTYKNILSRKFNLTDKEFMEILNTKLAIK
jgi:hypothetical protein